MHRDELPGVLIIVWLGLCIFVFSAAFLAASAERMP